MFDVTVVSSKPKLDDAESKQGHYLSTQSVVKTNLDFQPSLAMLGWYSTADTVHASPGWAILGPTPMTQTVGSQHWARLSLSVDASLPVEFLAVPNTKPG